MITRSSVSVADLPARTLIDLAAGPIELRVAFDPIRQVRIFAAGEVVIEEPFSPVRAADLRTYRAQLELRLRHAFKASWGRPGEPWPDCLPPMFAPPPAPAPGPAAAADQPDNDYEPPAWVDELPPMFGPARAA